MDMVQYYLRRNKSFFGGDMELAKFSVGDTLVMKKSHPCGSYQFTVLRVGTDIRIVCNECRRSIMIPRETLEKSIKRIISASEADKKDGI